MGDSGMPSWVSVHTEKVLGAFVGTLGCLPGWERLFIISPWLSTFDRDCGMSFAQFAKRLRDEKPALYIVTRPPAEAWHKEAIDELAATESASIVLLPSLHAKLFVAETRAMNISLVTSANFTRQSLVNREIGLLVRGKNEGRHLQRRLVDEAAQIYRSEGRTVFARRKI